MYKVEIQYYGLGTKGLSDKRSYETIMKLILKIAFDAKVFCYKVFCTNTNIMKED